MINVALWYLTINSGLLFLWYSLSFIDCNLKKPLSLPCLLLQTSCFDYLYHYVLMTDFYSSWDEFLQPYMVSSFFAFNHASFDCILWSSMKWLVLQSIFGTEFVLWTCMLLLLNDCHEHVLIPCTQRFLTTQIVVPKGMLNKPNAVTNFSLWWQRNNYFSSSSTSLSKCFESGNLVMPWFLHLPS